MTQKAGRQKPGTKTLLIAAAAVLGAAACIYIGAAVFFWSHFLPSTVLNGIDVSGKTAKEAEAMITRQTDGYEIAITGRDGQKETLRGADIALKPKFGDRIVSRIRQQNQFAWPAALFTKRKIEEVTVVNFNEEAFKETVGGLFCMQKENQKEPRDAYCSEYQAGGYRVVPHEEGSKIKKNKFYKKLSRSEEHTSELQSH